MSGAAPAKKKGSAAGSLRAALETGFVGRHDRLHLSEAGRKEWAGRLWEDRKPVPAAVVSAQNPGEVVDALEVARQGGVPVVMAAGRSPASGESKPRKSPLVIDVSAINRIEPVDRKSLVVRAGVGATLSEIEKHLGREDATLGIPGAAGSELTLLELLAHREPLLESPRYGRIDEALIAIEAVLPDGSLYTSRDAPRSAAGPDLKHLVVGSACRFGVPVSVTLRVHHKPEESATLGARFNDWTSAIGAAREVLQRRARPAQIAISGQSSVEPIDAETPVVLVLRFEGTSRLVAHELKIVRRIVAESGGVEQGESVAADLPFRSPAPRRFVAAARWRDLEKVRIAGCRVIEEASPPFTCRLATASVTTALLLWESEGANWSSLAVAVREAGGRILWPALHAGDPFADLEREMTGRLDASGSLSWNLPAAKKKRAPAKKNRAPAGRTKKS